MRGSSRASPEGHQREVTHWRLRKDSGGDRMITARGRKVEKEEVG